MHEELFGPVDTIVVVDTEAELLARMDAPNGALVASIAGDDAEIAAELAEHVQAFEVGGQQVAIARSHSGALRRARRVVEGRGRRRRLPASNPSRLHSS